MDTNLVSVITVVYNDVSHIEKTISNVLKQTYPFLEYIVVDGASTDGTLDVSIKAVEGGEIYIAKNGEEPTDESNWVSYNPNQTYTVQY